MIGYVKEDLAVESGLLHLISSTLRRRPRESPYVCADDSGKGRGLRHGALDHEACGSAKPPCTLFCMKFDQSFRMSHAMGTT